MGITGVIVGIEIKNCTDILPVKPVHIQAAGIDFRAVHQRNEHVIKQITYSIAKASSRIGKAAAFIFGIPQQLHQP